MQDNEIIILTVCLTLIDQYFCVLFQRCEMFLCYANKVLLEQVFELFHLIQKPIRFSFDVWSVQSVGLELKTLTEKWNSFLCSLNFGKYSSQSRNLIWTIHLYGTYLNCFTFFHLNVTTLQCQTQKNITYWYIELAFLRVMLYRFSKNKPWKISFKISRLEMLLLVIAIKFVLKLFCAKEAEFEWCLAFPVNEVLIIPTCVVHLHCSLFGNSGL